MQWRANKVSTVFTHYPLWWIPSHTHRTLAAPCLEVLWSCPRSIWNPAVDGINPAGPHLYYTTRIFKWGRISIINNCFMVSVREDLTIHAGPGCCSCQEVWALCGHRAHSWVPVEVIANGNFLQALEKSKGPGRVGQDCVRTISELFTPSVSGPVTSRSLLCISCGWETQNMDQDRARTSSTQTLLTHNTYASKTETHIYRCVHINTYTYACRYVCLCVGMYVCMYVGRHVCMYMCVPEGADGWL